MKLIIVLIMLSSHAYGYNTYCGENMYSDNTCGTWKPIKCSTVVVEDIVVRTFNLTYVHALLEIKYSLTAESIYGYLKCTNTQRYQLNYHNGKLLNPETFANYQRYSFWLRQNNNTCSVRKLGRINSCKSCMPSSPQFSLAFIIGEVQDVPTEKEILFEERIMFIFAHPVLYNSLVMGAAVVAIFALMALMLLASYFLYNQHT